MECREETPAARRGVCDDAAARAPREDGRGRSHRRDDVHVGRAIDGVVEEATSGKPAPPVMESIHSHRGSGRDVTHHVSHLQGVGSSGVERDNLEQQPRGVFRDDRVPFENTSFTLQLKA